MAIKMTKTTQTPRLELSFIHSQEDGARQMLKLGKIVSYDHIVNSLGPNAVILVSFPSSLLDCEQAWTSILNLKYSIPQIFN